MCMGRGQGYAGQGLALADLLAHLYFRVMRRRPDGSYLDRFVLSTGHSAIGLFAILGEVGLYEQVELRKKALSRVRRVSRSPAAL
jgi:transketolase